MTKRMPWGSGIAVASAPSPTITNINPNSGTSAGGTTGVAITGTNLSTASSVTIGGASATITGNTATVVTVTSPSGTVGQRDVTVVCAAGTVTYTGGFTYTTTTVVFHSDWSTNTGKADNTLYDSNQSTPWTLLTGSHVNGTPNVLEVAKATDIGINDAPTTNVLQVNHGYDDGSNVYSGQCGVTGLWPVPSNGQSLYLRWYMRCDVNDNEGDLTGAISSHHPIEWGYGGGLPTASPQINFASKNDGTFPWYFGNDQGSANNLDRQWRPSSVGGTIINLSKAVFYRYEIKLNRAGVDSYTVDIRIYNAANTLLYDGTTNTNVRNQNGTLVNAAPLYIGDTYVNSFEVGTNGASMFFHPVQIEHSYYAAVCVRSDDWCGAYSGGI